MVFRTVFLEVTADWKNMTCSLKYLENKDLLRKKPFCPLLSLLLACVLQKHLQSIMIIAMVNTLVISRYNFFQKSLYDQMMGSKEQFCKGK